jgi:hypothetical protein
MQGPQEEFYGMGTVAVIDGQFIDCGGYGGVVQAYNATTGTPLWNWTAPFYGIGSTYWQYTPTSLGVISDDGQMYLYTSEHSVSEPIRTDANIWDLNVTNGQLIWAEACWPSAAPILGDGILTVSDNKDNSIYAFGKGPSATTATVQDNVVTAGNDVLITGSVTDQSQSGRYDETGVLTHKLAGTPAIGDAYMDAYMEWFYHDAAYPTNATGVPVTLFAVDPNGNTINIGSTTSSATGFYSIPFKAPAVTGSYTVVAQFSGSNSYYGSVAETAFQDTAAPATSTPAPVSNVNFAPTQMYILGGVVAIIVVIAIIGAVILMTLRKRP